MGKTQKAALAVYNTFREVLNTIDFPYDDAVRQTWELMRNDFMDHGILESMKKYGIYHKARVYAKNGSLEFYEKGGLQFLNEFEKVIALHAVYNCGTTYLNAYLKPRYSKGKKIMDSGNNFAQAINTHDIRWIRVFLRNSNYYYDLWLRYKNWAHSKNPFYFYDNKRNNV